jgi:hypothetical protein
LRRWRRPARIGDLTGKRLQRMAAAAPDASIVMVIDPEVGDRTPGDAYR